jgi:hypothetical protein
MRIQTGLLLLAAVWLACNGCATNDPVTCGAGTHDDGTGTCVVDDALAVLNIVGSNYWSCPDPGCRSFVYKLSLGSTGATSGSGSFSSPFSSAGYSFTWQEGPGTNAITVSSSPDFDSLIDITPSAPTGAQSFTATEVKSGVHVFGLKCNLTLGSF